MKTQNAQLFVFLLLMENNFSSPMKKNTDLTNIDTWKGELDVVDTEGLSHLNEDNIDILKNIEYKVLLSTNEEDDYYDEDIDGGYSVYESIRDENLDILTKIEKLYTAFKSHENHSVHIPEIPLLSIVRKEPHKMIIMVKPKEVQSDTLVSVGKFCKRPWFILEVQFNCNNFSKDPLVL